MNKERKLWILFSAVMVLSFAVLGYYGFEIYQQMPPVPKSVQTEDGTVIFTEKEILDGQNVWQSIGGQQVGSIWGHGAYQAPDWSADWLHREALGLLDVWSHAQHGRPFEGLGVEKRGALELRLREEMRANRHDPATGTVVVSDARAQAIAANMRHYSALFGGDPSLAQLREDYALSSVPISDPVRLERLGQFFFWTAWACTTNRPGEDFTYTNNWPHEPLVGNRPTASNVLWSALSVLLLLAAAGA